MVTNAKQFRARLKKRRKRAAELILLRHRFAAEESAVRTHDRTPRRTGRTAANWNLSVGQRNETVLPEGNYAPRSRGEFRSAVSGLQAYGVTHLTNPLPQAEVLELGLYPGSGPATRGGFSINAPHGMLRISAQEVEAELKQLRFAGVAR